MKKLIKQLENAEGRSEFLIAVFCDIRGFSKFSTIHESPDLAMFIKRFYLKLLQVYFKDANYAKPTGDGLLIVFRYKEKTLPIIAEQVLSTCFQVVNDFPTMFNDDHMINFNTPSELGFGIARGTACCLFSKGQIIDYSGQLLNLAARLNDLARPKGIVLDGSFIESVIPSQFRNRFSKKRAYIKSIAEESPREVLCSEEVTLPSYAQYPITLNKWIMNRKKYKVSDLMAMKGNLGFDLTNEIYSREKTKLQFSFPNKSVPGYFIWKDYPSFDYVKDATGQHIFIKLGVAHEIITENQIPLDSEVTIEFQYIPKPKIRIKQTKKGNKKKKK